MASDALQILTGCGHIVQGHPMEARQKTDDNDKPVVDAQGKPVMQWYFGLAFPKTDPEFAKVWQTMQQAAQRDWPGGQFNSRDFSWKLIDGDSTDRNGKPYAQREGFAGHFILKIASNFAFQVVDQNAQPIVDPKALKCGDYGRVHLSIRGNGATGNKKPGIYLSPNFFQLLGYGKEISRTFDVSAALAGAQSVALPQGASAVPVAPSVPAIPGGPVGAPSLMPGVPGAGPAMGAPPSIPASAPGVPGAIGLPQVPGAIGLPQVPGVPAAPIAPGVPSVPAAPPPPPVFPPAGWTAHPQAPGHYYRGQEVVTEAQLRAMSVQPHTGILTPPR